MVLILPNATATSPLLEKSALHEPKIFFENGADRPPAAIKENYYIVDHRRDHRFNSIWHRAIDRLARLADSQFLSRRYRILTYPSGSIPARLAEPFAFSQNHHRRDKNCGSTVWLRPSRIPCPWPLFHSWRILPV